MIVETTIRTAAAASAQAIDARLITGEGQRAERQSGRAGLMDLQGGMRLLVGRPLPMSKGQFNRAIKANGASPAQPHKHLRIHGRDGTRMLARPRGQDLRSWVPDGSPRNELGGVYEAPSACAARWPCR